MACTRLCQMAAILRDQTAITGKQRAGLEIIPEEQRKLTAIIFRGYTRLHLFFYRNGAVGCWLDIIFSVTTRDAQGNGCGRLAKIFDTKNLDRLVEIFLYLLYARTYIRHHPVLPTADQLDFIGLTHALLNSIRLGNQVEKIFGVAVTHQKYFLFSILKICEIACIKACLVIVARTNDAGEDFLVCLVVAIHEALVSDNPGANPDKGK